MKQKRYITTTLPYVNADPHIGFAMELVQADVIARFWRLQGHKVIFNTGTDEHGLKIYQKAQEEKKDPQTYCDEYAAKFENLKSALNLSYTHFIRTTDPDHKKAAQEFWMRCDKNGYIDKKMYKVKYCVGCELEKTDSELVDGRCPLHPNRDLEIYEEENYFFKFSLFKEKLLKLYSDNPSIVVPDYRLKEITNFIEKGPEDFSISRLKKKLPWGVDVPNDPEHVMYVWFDALINYISTLGWPHEGSDYHDYWPGIQIAGKDNLRQQSAMWQSMLIAAGLPNTKQILIHGFITSEGQKMSKSLGNVVNPIDLVQQFGTDALRYYLLKEIPTFDDGDFSLERCKEVYNADLANGLGNLIARITKLAEGRSFSLTEPKLTPAFTNVMESYNFNEALSHIWHKIRELDRYINDNEPWKITDEGKLTEVLTHSLNEIYFITYELQPFLPQTAEKILTIFKNPSSIQKLSGLFPRL